MKKQDIQKKIKQLGPWYQRISLDGIITGRKRDVEQTWKIIEDSFPINYKLSRILDLGCNAGFYSIMAAKKGASVVGIEAGQKPFEQAIFLKNYFEDLWDIKLDITYIHKDISDVDFIKLGNFDYIFALAILYHIGNSKFGKGTPKSFTEQDRVISLLTKITDKFIVRARQRKRKNSEYYNSEYYNKVFKNLGFRSEKTIYEEKGDRSLILYKRG
jgi:SAM-dependent methyltransferase